MSTETGPRDRIAAPSPAPAGAARPTSATVLGSLNLIFGGIEIVLGLGTLASLLLPHSPSAHDVKARIPGAHAVDVAAEAAGTVAAALLVASGVGLLKGRRFGRTLAIVYACLELGIRVARFAYFLAVLFRPLMDQLTRAEDQAAMVAALPGLVVGFTSIVVGPIYPLVLLYFMNRPLVVAYDSRRERNDHGHLHTP